MKPAFSELSPHLLATFLAVADSNGVLPAARRLGRSQPAVTARIQQLESMLGVPLFVRSSQGMALTDAGKKLRIHARQVQALLEEVAKAFSEKDAPGEPLVMAASTTIAASVLPPLLARFSERHILSGISLRVGNTAQVLEWVRTGEVSLGLVEGEGRAQAVHMEPFMQDELLPVYAPAACSESLLSRIRSMKNIRDLAGLPILWREPGSGTRKVVEKALAKAGVPARSLRQTLMLGETEAIKGGVMLGMGVAFLSRCSIARELADGTMRPIPSVSSLRIPRYFRWVLAGGGVPKVAEDFKNFANREVR